MSENTTKRDELILNAIGEIAAARRALEQRKEEHDALVGAALDTLAAAGVGEAERKAVKRAAEARARNRLDALREDIAGMTRVLELA